MQDRRIDRKGEMTARGAGSRWPLAAAILLACISAAMVVLMERRDAGLLVERLRVDMTPVTLIRPPTSAAPLPLVVVAHGFGGSRQMMDQIAVTLARGGLAVASFDFPGHGRNPALLSPDVTRIEGTTTDLVRATLEVTEAMRARPGIGQSVSFVGHSMATDVIIRAAAETSNVASIAAISMYSDAVTEEHPENLLIVSGAREDHLREVALGALHQVAAGAGENETAVAGDVRRRAVVAPFVGHVGVLYASRTLEEIAPWIAASAGQSLAASWAPDQTGWVAGVLLVALAALAWPLAALLPARRTAPPPALPRRTYWLAVLLPVPLAALTAHLTSTTLAGAAGFDALAAAFAIWAAVQLVVLSRAGIRPLVPDALGSLAYLVWGLGVFALALDRYGAAFLPTGPRIQALAVLALGCVPLMLADSMMVAGATLWRRIVARLMLIATLAGAMALAPTELGLNFTVLPVLVLFFLVYGSFARLVASRRGPGAAWPAAGLALAWAIAASTPLFATGPVAV